MGYCTSCGAYIPDGQTRCLACGFDENAEKKETGSAATAAATEKAPGQERSQHKYRQFDSETLRRQLEEQRKRQQENSRKWAETEYAQRQRVKEEQARNFTNTSRTSGANTNKYTDTVRSTVQSADLSKLMAGMSYVSALFLIPMLLAGNDSFATYHAKQGMKLFLAGLIGRIAGSLLGLGWLVTLAQIYLAYIGIQNVISGKRRPLPYVGELFEK